LAEGKLATRRSIEHFDNVLMQHGQVHLVTEVATATSNTLGLRGTVDVGSRLTLLLAAVALMAKSVVRAKT